MATGSGTADVSSVTSAGNAVTVVVEALRQPGLVVLAGAPGIGRSTLLRRVASLPTLQGPALAGGGLAMLRGVPAFALTRAVRARLPHHDVPLLAEAVRSRVRGGLLVVDDLQWADPVTLAALPLLARHCRVLTALRLPHGLPDGVEGTLREAGTWLTLSPWNTEASMELARRVAPGSSVSERAAVVRRAGGVPLAVVSLARGLTQPRPGGGLAGDDDPERSGLAYAVATALADLARPARTSLAALGLLGRPAEAQVLGPGVGPLREAGLVVVADGVVTPVSPYTAEVAAGLLSDTERRAMHRELAKMVPPREAARHLAAAGEVAAAYQSALVASATPGASAGERAETLLLACGVAGARTPGEVRLAAARAALDCGRPGSCLRVLSDFAGEEARVLRAEAFLLRGNPDRALAEVAGVGEGEGLAAVDRVRLLGLLAMEPGRARRLLPSVAAIHGDPPGDPGLRAAVAAVRTAGREPGWERALAEAAACAGNGGEVLAARWSAWLLVETLASDGRLEEAARAARAGAAACSADVSYSWQTRFVAAGLWCQALRGVEIDEVVRRAGDLTDVSLPEAARGYAVAAASLAEADGGLLAPARARLAAAAGGSSSAVALAWVSRETAWLDGQPEAASEPFVVDSSPLVAGLARITARWAAHDTEGPASQPPDEGDDAELDPVRLTLGAWRSVGGFVEAAGAWHDLVRREEIRCLLAAGTLSEVAEEAVPSLLAAERLAEEAGLVVLLGRVRRALRRHSVRRDTRGRRAGDALTDRELEILCLVARGEPTRRIAGQLGISRDTVETHIRSGMRKLGAHTRTEAAALATEVWR